MKKKLLGLTAAVIITTEIIIGNVDWHLVETETDPTILENAESSLYLALPGARCSGSVIYPEHIISNFHCLGNGVGKFKVTAEYMKSVSNHLRKWFSCEKIVASNMRLDYSIAYCPGMDLIPITVNVDAVKKNDPIYLIHQNCDWKTNRFCIPNKIVSNGNVESVGLSVIEHNGDTLGGSSGSAMFLNDGMIALHNKGYSTPDGKGIKNSGVSMRSIIGSLSPEIREKIETVGDIDSVQNTFSSNLNRDTSGYKYVKKKSFKCRYFGWVFKRKCRG